MRGSSSLWRAPGLSCCPGKGSKARTFSAARFALAKEEGRGSTSQGRPGRAKPSSQPPLCGAGCEGRAGEGGPCPALARGMQALGIRGFSAKEGGPSEGAGIIRRKRAWERSLSPLERLSRILPGDLLLSPEIQALRSTEQKVQEEDEAAAAAEPSSKAAPRRAFPFQIGDLILAEVRRRRGMEFKKLGKLSSPRGALNSNWGALRHQEILGKLPGQIFRTSTGHSLLVRRPALEDYVILMKRGPTISYPKDINTMLLLMDISPGDTVLEAGSGSGGMSLFLSRAVGPQGHVISYEVRREHHTVAKKNYQTWCDAWRIGHTVEWPDNVDFINANILTAAEDLKTITFDAIALDMVLPQNVLPTVIPHLKQGGICAIYLANITQVVDLLEAIRTSKLTLFCERIMEVTHRDWLVLPTTWKNGDIFQNGESKQDFDNESDGHCGNDETSEEEREHDEAFVSDSAKPPYIARPYPWQIGHSAFLVKLRKFNPAYSDTVPNITC
ncbi:LOW QUALITY PROTEIN: tRNA (adenine(58)-N(1))-methyltransferase, mitochondrial [Sceloporus undulatus]|uniref:LOW QUALITY PROTEIN: tRNA (adenine(58)-N(1))-methyltransferase, mitochondrial n=1 Tax=Sceloporus undulatus TaxID=8520 RepID=UPI001C4C325C|nr:LOW QUALITY PROTEIN: tRNA (adenine(58)-N(1))-methyltransferase, mitochondrial [Sceloporus undulatus]